MDLTWIAPLFCCSPKVLSQSHHVQLHDCIVNTIYEKCCWELYNENESLCFPATKYPCLTCMSNMCSVYITMFCQIVSLM